MAEIKVFSSERKTLFLLAGIILAGIFVRFGLSYLNRPVPLVIEQQQEQSEAGVGGNINNETSEINEIMVHVSGAVVAPGVYKLAEGSRAIDALEMAGGPAEDAWEHGVNLAEKLYDGQALFIPSKGEAGDATYPSAIGVMGSGKININTATQSQLEELPGIGPTRAAQIIEYRKTKGRFQDIYDLTGVSGIGAGTVENIKDLVVY